ncbi:hypothetical protein E4V42_03750 [Clostridium estertheticum]|uniref:Uncharacterized protein n=1 Tax=Clostridium estertheticum TaxID=238834 RepID=A0A5N7IXM5_9CLOT|nr:hypothetical protein [Clostridium estertheticum]MPQ30551.1 hypothetical protein [Clostridium estertheticum]MPQ61227.1 hypothetical protein [Clostridium estertheticum]
MIDNTCHDAKCQTTFSGALGKYLFTGLDLAIKLPKSSELDIDVIGELTDKIKIRLREAGINILHDVLVQKVKD